MVAAIIIVITTVEGSLYYKEYISGNQFREPLSKCEDHCWLVGAQDKGDKLSEKQM